MTRFRPHCLAAVACATVALAAGCGGNSKDLKANDVAKVDDTAISQQDLDVAIKANAALAQTTPGHGQIVTPDPPKFTRCIAQLRKQQAAPTGGTDALKRQCQA